MVVTHPSIDKSALLLQAVVDHFTHPAWIEERGQPLVVNTCAQDCADAGVQIASLVNNSVVRIGGKQYHLFQSELNHGTDCYLRELRYADDQAERIRESAKRVSSVLERLQ